MPDHHIITIGASSGGVDALQRVIAPLPADLPAAVLIVLHRPATSPSLLPEILQHVSALPVAHAVDGEPVIPGRVYVAVPDRHLLVESERIRLTRGPKENRFRPAIDPLFRSAALTYGPRTIGVVLTGSLDDGTAGLWAIKDRGGIAVVQDPADALYPSMPRNALANVAVDHCLRLDAIAPMLRQLSAQPVTGGAAVSEQLKIETRIALEHSPLEVGVLGLGTPSLLTCPECHGILLKIQDGQITRYRCHTGHGYSINSLLDAVTEAVEGNLWNAARAMDEYLLLLAHVREAVTETDDSAAGIEEQLETIRRRIHLVRQALLRTGAAQDERAGATISTSEYQP